MRCTQPGCDGRIVDGYCDTCGMLGDAPAAAPAPAPAAGGEPARTAGAAPGGGFKPSVAVQPRSSGPCRQPGCPGTVVDGYCDTCGAPADAAPLIDAPAAAVVPAADGEPEPSQQTRTSNRLGSTALGSARVGGTSRVRTASARLRAARLGAGLTQVPPAPAVDPLTALMPVAEVPQNRRTCPSCGEPVGRQRGDTPGRSKGYCPHCGAAFDFTPKLKQGDLVAGQYEVQGALAHGGMGWIYLARDRNVSNRWVVLKGLLNSDDPDLVASAIAEQQFLAQVSHPLIVEIYNFVQHEGAGYIVMEYVGGRSLKQLLKERLEANGGSYSPLPVDWAIAFMIEALPALGYLHDNGLVYCDFKPDNVVQVGDGIKIIDLGGVRRLDDDESALYGTVGYQAPEVATSGASVASDLYTVGRTLVVLCAEFRGYQSTYQYSLPTPDEMPIFAKYDSLYRLLLKCCAPDPRDRFASADELRTQLLGVLREVVGARTPGQAQSSAASLLFGPPTAGSAIDWSQLPALRVDTTDPQYAFLASVDIDDPRERLRALGTAPGASPEVDLARARAALELGDRSTLDQVVTHLLGQDPWDWRAVWMAGLGALQAGDIPAAQASFNAVYGQLPGELAPKLALAVACERGGEPAIAETLYAICASTDANYVTPAAFGLERLRAGRGDLAGALQALDMVPVTSRGYSESRRLRAQHLVAMSTGLRELAVAMEAVNDAHLEPAVRDRYAVEIYQRALRQVSGRGPAPGVVIDGAPATAPALRLKLEQGYRDLARHEPDAGKRATLIDDANRIRKWSLT